MRRVTHHRKRVTVLVKEKVSVSGLQIAKSFHYLSRFVHEDYLHQDLHGVILAFFAITKLDLLSASFMKPRIDSIWATEYGEVETLQVKESTKIQPPNSKEHNQLHTNTATNQGSKQLFGRLLRESTRGMPVECRIK